MNVETWTCTPLIVFAGAHRQPTEAKLRRTAQFRTQEVSIKVYSSLKGSKTNRGIFIVQQPQDKHPIPENQLFEILKANPKGEGIIVEDFTRLINTSGRLGILRQLAFLQRFLPEMFSIRQHNTISEIGEVGLFNLACIEEARRLDQSTRAKRAAATKDPDESKAASRKANAVKTALAGKKAVKLRQHIDKIRDSLPDSDRSNRAAIARQLNEANIPTSSGTGKWQSITVSRVLQVAAEHDRQREELRQKMEARKQKLLQTTNRTPSGM